MKAVNFFRGASILAGALVTSIVMATGTAVAIESGPGHSRSALADIDRLDSEIAMVKSPVPGRLLTGPSEDRPVEVTLDYVREHGETFGLLKSDFANLKVVARDVTPDGITHLRFNQVLDGIESFDRGLDAHVTADGRLVAISGAPLPGAGLPAISPELSAVESLVEAREATDGGTAIPRKSDREAGPERATTFASGERTQLRWVEGSNGPELVWNTITDGADGSLYDVLVTAEDGELLRRQALTSHLGENRYFPRDPQSTPVRTGITMPPAWYTDHAGGTRLWGEYARTYTDPDNQNPAPGSELGGARVQIPASGGAPSAPNWIYPQSTTFPGATPCPSTGCTWNSADPATQTINQFQAGSNLHALVSRFHGHLAQSPIGFDEASGNFQLTNTTGQGLGNDYVQAELNDGEDLNNANMSTPPDGMAPRMQMFLFDGQNVNGSDAADVVYHEYGHGLSNRLLVTAGGGSGISSFQAAMMGEAWSDFYALDLLETEGSIVDMPGVADVVTGSYVTGSPGGIRSKPIDCPVDPGGFTGCDRNGTGTTVLGGYTYGDITHTQNVSPHNGGEIWAETLWDIREAVGRQAALKLVTGGMRMTVDSPSMLDARDAILLQAVAMRTSIGAPDDFYPALWSIFANRGMGISASTVSAEATDPTEAFDMPTGIRDRGTVIRDPYPGGDNDGLIEPGERFVVDQKIQGVGLADLAGVSGTMTSGDPAVTVEDGSAGWPLLGYGRQEINADELAGRLPMGVCSATSPLSIEVNSTVGNLATTATVDPRPAVLETIRLADATGDQTTQFPQTTTAKFNVRPGGGLITDVDLRIDELRHSYLGDLEISLSHAGVTVTITDQFGDPVFAGKDIIGAIFDDEAASLPDAVTSPVSGRFKASEQLSAFDGLPANGIWALKITDHYPGDSGELKKWGLDSPAVPCGRVEIPEVTTGDAGQIGQALATLAGSITPNGRDTGARISYGTTTSYGSSTSEENAGSGDEPMGVSARIDDLLPDTTYHYRVEAMRDGEVAVAGADRTFKTDPVPVVVDPEDKVAPVFTGRVTVKLAKVKRTKLRRATFGFSLNEPSTVRLKLTRTLTGHRKGGRCVTSKRGKGKRCARAVPAGKVTRAFAVGGKLKLKLGGKGFVKGRYTAILVATDSSGNSSKAKRVRFTVR